MRATLTVLSGIHTGMLHTLERGALVFGRDLSCDVPVDDPGISRRHARVGLGAESSFYVEDLASTNGTYINAHRVTLGELRPGDELQLGPQLRLRFALTPSCDEAMQRKIYEASVRDALTGAFNRRYFDDRLLGEIARARAAAGVLALLMIDVDRFKRMNDEFGHLAGDRALFVIASQLARVVRVEDVVARFGGDEFAIIATGASSSDAAALGERARRCVEALPFRASGRAVPVTVSVGVSALHDVDPSEHPCVELLALADRRLYEAKQQGRNRVAM